MILQKLVLRAKKIPENSRKWAASLIGCHMRSDTLAGPVDE
jgi:hypothetical protein